MRCLPSTRNGRYPRRFRPSTTRGATPSYEVLSELLDLRTTVLLAVECRQGVVGPDSALPELAAEARS
jgi:hypothetical protein